MVIVFIIALIIRVALTVEVWALPLVRTPRLDSAEYVSWARRIAAGDFAWPLLSQHGPGYPFFLAALLVIGSGSLRAALFAQAVVGALTATLIAAIARDLFDARVALFAGLAYAVYGPAAYIDTAFLSEGLLVFLVMLAVLVLCREPLTKTRAAVAGAAFGVATLVRPTALAIAAAGALWIIASAPFGRLRAFSLAAVLAFTCTLGMSPALSKNWSTSRSLAIQGYGGLNFYIGNSPLHNGRAMFRPGNGWDVLNSAASRAGITDPTAQDRYYVAKTFSEIRKHFGAFAKLVAIKTLWLVQAEEVRDSHSFYFFTDRLWVLRILPRMALLFPFAAIGLFTIVARRGRTAVLLYVGLAAAATAVSLVVGTRYRMPLVPVLAIVAGAGLDAVIRSIQVRRARRLLAYALVASGAVVVSHVLSDPSNHNLAEEWAFTGSSLVTERNLPQAESAYRRALALDPKSGLAWDGMGLVALNSRRPSQAREAFSRAIAIDGDNSRAIFHLGLVDEQEGHLQNAVAEFKRASDLSPFDLEIVRHLGEALLADRKAADAVPYLRTAAGQMPNDADMHRALATALAMSGQLADARKEMQIVVGLAPTSGEAWLDFCLLSLDLRDFDGAAFALQRARDLGAAPERLTFASAALARAQK